MATTQQQTWPAALVRQTFTDYFNQREHVVYPSSPVIPPPEETTLLFTNAGMNQFKSIFVGTCAPDSPMGKLKAAGRVANSQKCIRAGGKHNDLDDVGKDTYHHTFFEMLGNWSFGNYFKKEAIEWAWDLLTNVYKLDPSRLYATYFGGNADQNLPADDEARELWLRFLPKERVLPFGMKDNFWEMGDTGPCGPCTEIHYDRIGGRDGAKLVNNDDPTLIEIWNLVFMQFNRDEKGGKLTPLPAPCVDTGMGFERLVSVLQDVQSNYDTDVWDRIFQRIHEVTGFAHSYKGGSSMDEPDVAYRVIADHIRTLTFAIADGGAPSKDGRGFVLRRIVRRAIRYGREILGAKVGFFSELVDAVSESLGPAFPEVADQKQVARVKAVLRSEELLFDRTWEQGLKHFTVASGKAKEGVISGEDAFILHDRYGFPIDLTQIMAERSKLKVDMAQYESIMEHKKKTGSGEKMAARRGALGVDQLHLLEVQQKVAATEDQAKYQWESTGAKVLAVYNIGTQQFLDQLEEYAESVAVILDRTNFYCESGGQVGDQGHLELPGGKVFLVEDTQKYGGYVAHIGAHQGQGKIAVGDSVVCSVDYERRKAIAANHTTTHVLNHALREVLIVRPKNEAEKVDQKGSLVDERMLRFDFSWASKLTDEQLAEVEEEVNRQIRDNRPVFTQEVAKEEADKICSLRSVFGEKYPAFVRVVSVGRDIKELLADPSNPEWFKYSVEFCGGTHLSNSSEAEEAVVISETAIGGNVRRIVLLTQQPARDSIQLTEDLKAELTTIAAVANLKERDRALGKFGKKVDDATIPVVRKNQLRLAIQEAFDVMKKEQKERQAQVKEFGVQIGEQIVKELEASPSAFVVAVLNDYNPNVAGEREATNEAIKVIDKKAPATAHLLINKDEETAAVTATVPKDKAAQLDAGEWVRSVCGKGGGKPTSAQGAGLPVAAVADAVLKARQFAAERLQK